MTTDPDNPDNEVMCQCSGTRRKQIRDLCQQGLDLQGISRVTGVLTGCGGCEWDVLEYFGELAQQRKKAAGGG